MFSNSCLRGLKNLVIAKIILSLGRLKKKLKIETPHALESNGKPYSTLFKDKTFEEVAGEWYARFDFVELD